jgi:CubicO group peptidase (beta-lactamase class C family)
VWLLRDLIRPSAIRELFRGLSSSRVASLVCFFGCIVRRAVAAPIFASILSAFSLFPAHLFARQLDARSVDAAADAALKTWDVPGLAIVIVTPDRVLWLKGYGRRDVAADRPMTPDTVFPLASCSKAFTTALAAMLVGEGKLKWDDPVRKHLPDFHLSDPLADANVTLRDLMCHRTGLSNNDFLWYRAPWPPAEVISRTSKMPLEKPFRTAFQYQSAMYTAAGFAVAKAGGDSWEKLVKRRLFEPLGMKSARCVTPRQEEALELATPYRAGPDGRLQSIPWYDQPLPNPAGSIHVSARDLAAWLQFHLAGGKFGGRQMVSPAALAETHRPQVVIRMDEGLQAANPDTALMNYGLAWVIQDYRGHELVSHGGVIDGFRVHITLLPRDGFALAILSNRHQTQMNIALSNILVDRLLNLPPRDWNDHFKRLEQRAEEVKREVRITRNKLRTPDQPAPRPLAKYAGEYDHFAYGRARISVDDGALRWQWSSFRDELTHHHDDVFELKSEFPDEPLIEFRVDDKGNVTGFVFLNLEFKKSQSH